VAKMALIERELKRDKLVAKYAKKHAELKAIANDPKRATKSALLPAWRCRSCRATPTPPASATVAKSPAVPVARSASSVWPRQDP
jgi:hypothetical protein